MIFDEKLINSLNKWELLNIKNMTKSLALISSFILFSMSSFAEKYCPVPETKRSVAVKERLVKPLQEALKKKNMILGAPLFIRIFKKERQLELWVKVQNEFKHFKTYPICSVSGELGPKRKRGDGQAPEGFYFITPQALNPQSRFHLALNVGYPNLFDKASSCTGDYIMIHGGCCSIGCFAMTDPYIEEIYTLVAASLEYGQSEIPVHIFPFHLKDKELAKYKKNNWHSFWSMLQPIYLAFEKKRVPPTVKFRNKLYHFDDKVS